MAILGLTFNNTPEEIVIGFVFVFSMLAGMLIIRSLYIIMHRAHLYANDEIHLAVDATTAMKCMILPLMVVLLILLNRATLPIASGQFWTMGALENGWWCVIRVMLGVLLTLSASVYETHPLFRAWVSLTLPLISILDLISHQNYAARISCLEHGICIPNPPLLAQLYTRAYRDLFSAFISLTYFCVSVWAWFLLGVYRNDMHFPREEHRRMTRRLDHIRIKPKITRRKTNEEESLEKMLGYN
jgi:hypothetical protein